MGKIIRLFVSKRLQNNTYGNLALDYNGVKNVATYEKPVAKKMVKKNAKKKVFMGCWDCCSSVDPGNC